ncbi:MAG: hypothetical protein AB7N54_15720 [Alphaproteobacteria bacterium]
MKKLVLILAGVLVAAGVGGWLMLGGEGEPADVPPPRPPRPDFVPLRPLTANVFDHRNQLVGRFTAELTLEVDGETGREAVRLAMTRLMDDYLAELHTMLDHEQANGPRVDIDLIKARLMRASERELGPGLVKDVLIQTLLRRGREPPGGGPG